MALKVVGVGLGRTGTASTKLALEQLGFGPCYHMSEVFEKPERMGGWMEAAGGSPDWDTVFDGYQACVDYPAATFWRELAEHYSDAKVLLNVRDPDSWFESVSETIMNPEMVEATRERPQFGFLQACVYGEMEGRTGDRSFMVDWFNRHVAEVRAAIPAERLLVFEVKQGWGPLCEFLGVDEPEGEFPRVNSREETKKILKLMAEADGWEQIEGRGSAADGLFQRGGSAGS